MAKSGKDNPNWRGGRSISSHGYVLLRVGAQHHLADVRGYAYEHRVKAEIKLGRRLQPGEQIHHLDGDKTNNSDDNLVISESKAEHAVYHRRRGDLRLPTEANPTVMCACGCKRKLLKYDKSGRPRQYISGHNPSVPAVAQDAILAVIGEDGLHRNHIARACHKSVQSVATVLSRLKAKGLIEQIGRGVWKRRMS